MSQIEEKPLKVMICGYRDKEPYGLTRQGLVDFIHLAMHNSKRKVEFEYITWDGLMKKADEDNKKRSGQTILKFDDFSFVGGNNGEQKQQ